VFVPSVDLKTIPVAHNIDAGKITEIVAIGKPKGVNYNEFMIIGDETLMGITDIGNPQQNLDQFQAQLDPIIQRFASAFPNLQGRRNSCQNQDPVSCVVSNNTGIVFISTGSAFLQGQISIEDYRTVLTNTVTGLAQNGIIPVLVTVPGPIDDENVLRVNDVIYQVSQEQRIPLMNLYTI
jgi:hypothetical protein